MIQRRVDAVKKRYNKKNQQNIIKEAKIWKIEYQKLFIRKQSIR